MLENPEFIIDLLVKYKITLNQFFIAYTVLFDQQNKNTTTNASLAWKYSYYQNEIGYETIKPHDLEALQAANLIKLKSGGNKYDPNAYKKEYNLNDILITEEFKSSIIPGLEGFDEFYDLYPSRNKDNIPLKCVEERTVIALYNRKVKTIAMHRKLIAAMKWIDFKGLTEDFFNMRPDNFFNGNYHKEIIDKMEAGDLEESGQKMV